MACVESRFSRPAALGSLLSVVAFGVVIGQTSPIASDAGHFFANSICSCPATRNPSLKMRGSACTLIFVCGVSFMRFAFEILGTTS